MLEEIMSAPGSSLAKIHALGCAGWAECDDREAGPRLLLQDEDAAVRERGVVAAITMERRRGAGGKSSDYVPAFWSAIAPLANDPAPRVRFYAALAAGYAGDECARAVPRETGRVRLQGLLDICRHTERLECAHCSPLCGAAWTRSIPRS